MTSPSETKPADRKKLTDRIAALKKQTDAAKKHAKSAKAGVKEAKQKFKEAKRAAKKLRKATKALENELFNLTPKKPSRKPVAKKSTKQKPVAKAPELPEVNEVASDKTPAQSVI